MRYVGELRSECPVVSHTGSQDPCLMALLNTTIHGWVREQLIKFRELSSKFFFRREFRKYGKTKHSKLNTQFIS